MTKFPIRIYTLNSSMTAFGLLAEVDDYENAYFTRSFVDVGDFQITINYNKVNAQYFSRGAIVQFGSDTRKAGYITEIDVAVDQGGKGSQTVTVKGWQLKYLLSKRVMLPAAGQTNYYITTDAETVMKSAISDQAGATATNAKRKISLLNILTNQHRGPAYCISATYTNLQDELKACALSTYVGYEVVLNLSTGKLDVDVFLGVDRRGSQLANGRAIFSTDLETIQALTVQDSEVSYKNLAVVGGLGTGAARTVIQAYLDAAEPADAYRSEVFADFRQCADADLPSKGASALAQLATSVFMDGQALAFSTLLLGRDFDLGDLCTLQAGSKSYDARLTAVRENLAPGSYAIDLTWGQPYPTLASVVDSQNAISTQLINSSLPGIVDSGSNSNGSYIKFGDGTLWQYGSIAITMSAGLQGYAITFPAAFLTADVLDHPLSARVHPATHWSFTVPGGDTIMSATSSNVVITNTGSGQNAKITWFAIGKYK